MIGYVYIDVYIYIHINAVGIVLKASQGDHWVEWLCLGAPNHHAQD